MVPCLTLDSDQDISQLRLEEALSNVQITVSDTNETLDSPSATPEPFYGSLLATIREEDGARVASLDDAEGRSQKRVLKELQLFHRDTTIPYISVAPIDGALDNCLACVEGSPDSVFAGGVFWLHLTFPVDYPQKRPSVKFVTPVYHPNIDNHGRLCIDTLDSAWSPISTITTICNPLLSKDISRPKDTRICTRHVQNYLSYSFIKSRRIC